MAALAASAVAAALVGVAIAVWLRPAARHARLLVRRDAALARARARAPHETGQRRSAEQVVPARREA